MGRRRSGPRSLPPRSSADPIRPFNDLACERATRKHVASCSTMPRQDADSRPPDPPTAGPAAIPAFTPRRSKHRRLKRIRPAGAGLANRIGFVTVRSRWRRFLAQLGWPCNRQDTLLGRLADAIGSTTEGTLACEGMVGRNAKQAGIVVATPHPATHYAALSGRRAFSTLASSTGAGPGDRTRGVRTLRSQGWRHPPTSSYRRSCVATTSSRARHPSERCTCGIADERNAVRRRGPDR